MNTLLTILGILAGIVTVILVIAAALPKSFSTEKNIDINAPKNRVFNYIKMLKNQDNYSKWNMTDPGMKRIFTGTDGTPGFIYAWDGNKKAGEGEQEITSIIEGSTISSDVRFVRPFPGLSNLVFKTDALSDNLTKVSWTTKSSMKFPMNAMVPMVKGMIGKDMEISLGNLKRILEKE